VPDQIEATAEDTLVSVIAFENGAMGQWTAFNAAHGRRFGYSGIYGRLGSLHSPGARNGAVCEVGEITSSRSFEEFRRQVLGNELAFDAETMSLRYRSGGLGELHILCPEETIHRPEQLIDGFVRRPPANPWGPDGGGATGADPGPNCATELTAMSSHEQPVKRDLATGGRGDERLKSFRPGVGRQVVED